MSMICEGSVFEMRRRSLFMFSLSLKALRFQAFLLFCFIDLFFLLFLLKELLFLNMSAHVSSFSQRFGSISAILSFSFLIFTMVSSSNAFPQSWPARTFSDLEKCPEKRRVGQATKRIANQLLESRKIKRRRCSIGAPPSGAPPWSTSTTSDGGGGGAPSLLDEEDDDFIAKAIESKSTCHGRRHETTLFTHHRVKKSHFLSLANHSLSKRGKKLIKSATTVTNRGKPRNVKSLAAETDRGKWLWCANKPPKTEASETESTHHQRAHIRNAKFSMFAKGHEKHSVVISMDDKAYLRPGTDVGARDTKAGVVYDVVDPLKAGKLPQHDFNQAQVNQTPASFRFIKGHVEEIENKNNLVNDNDQTIVIIRPKYYIGSSDSVWASDYHEHLSLFQESRQSAISNTLNKFVCHIHDILFYFVEITMKEDVQSATTEPSCPFRKYEEEKLEWLLQQIEVAVLTWREEKEGSQNKRK